MPGPGFRHVGSEERENVLEALSAGTMTRYAYERAGRTSCVYRFERRVEELFGVPHCVAVNSGTSALLAGLAALGVGPGDEVIVPGYTFIASIASVVTAGAVPVLAEIDETLGLDPHDVEAKITPRTKAIMAVHMLGSPADVPVLREIADRYGIALIEDVAQACGGSVGGRRLGAFGDVGAFSLNYFKVITSGEGGFVLTSSRERYHRAYAFHDHGFLPDRAGVAPGDSIFGLNLRMTDLAGGVALAQIGKLDRILARTRALRDTLSAEIGTLPSARRRRLVDPGGDCASALVYLFDTPGLAAEVARSLGTIRLIESGKHYYGDMPQLRRLAARTVRASPFQNWSGPGEESYRVGALPRTDDILARSVALSVGMSDHYTGTGFGISTDSTDEDVARVAARFRDVAGSVRGVPLGGVS
ncbi:DegT/DnrJ/EryC1/StrS family aminotransferase [Actinomadura roseirufa]|uniref:DegT/DnrJ/EryC1/StrS family aminotransferase n=1 Tax=Actinomadura roseirufa TaxID=2094049 RepID=UPI001040E7E9|nr:DegT/DnrJ/EryC1/StrS family aminotransferase [Actinomadura roseirufa]